MTGRMRPVSSSRQCSGRSHLGFDFDKVDFFVGPSGRPKPYCTEHGAMNKVADWEDNEGMWRCLRSENTEDCRAGCIERRDSSQNGGSDG